MKKIGLLGVLWTLAAASVALAISGIPFAAEVVTGTTVETKGITATLCKVGNIETPALVQIASNSIYYSLASSGATPGYAGAPYYYAAAGDIIEVGVPSKFRVRGTTSGVTWAMMVTCFAR